MRLADDIRVIADATTEPVSLAEQKFHSRIDANDQGTNNTLDIYIAAARRHLEKRAGITIHQKTLEISLDCWPWGNYVTLPRATPLIAIVEAAYKDTAGAETIWASTEYIADTKIIPGRLVLGHQKSWPSTELYPASPIRIRYTAGIQTTSPITEADEDVKNAVLLMAEHLWEHREAVMVGQTTNIDIKRLEFAFEMFAKDLLKKHVF